MGAKNNFRNIRWGKRTKLQWEDGRRGRQ